MSKLNNGMFSSDNEEWETPKNIFNELNRYFEFTLDVAATTDNAKVSRCYTKSNSAFDHSWAGERCFMNPPYGKGMGRWLNKVYVESVCTFPGALIVCLIPARTDTKWFHEYVVAANRIVFLSGRLKFEIGGQALSSAPFPSLIAVFHRMDIPDHIQRTISFVDGFCHRSIKTYVR